MLVAEFLNLFLDDLLEEARQRHLLKPDYLGFQAAVDAIDECRDILSTGMAVRNLKGVYKEAQDTAEDKLQEDAPDAWYWIVRATTIAWTAEVLSVLLLQRHEPVIVPPRRCAAEEVARLVFP